MCRYVLCRYVFVILVQVFAKSINKKLIGTVVIFIPHSIILTNYPNSFLYFNDVFYIFSYSNKLWRQWDSSTHTPQWKEMQRSGENLFTLINGYKSMWCIKVYHLCMIKWYLLLTLQFMHSKIKLIFLKYLARITIFVMPL